MLKFLKFSAFFGFALMAFACQKVPEKPHNPVLAESWEEKKMNLKVDQQWQEGADVLFILKTRELVLASKNPPEGFYVRGKIERGRFKPKTNVLGIGDLAKDGRYGWLEINSKEFYPMESDRKADTPFIKGYLTNEIFKPSERDVIDTP